MKKMFALALTLCMLLGCIALAEEEWVTYKLGEMSYALPESYELELEDPGEVSHRMEINSDDVRYDMLCFGILDEVEPYLSYEEWIDTMEQLAEMYNENFTWEYRDIAGYQGVVCSSDFGTIKENAFYCIVKGKAYEVIESASSPTIERLDFEEFLKTINFETERKEELILLENMPYKNISANEILSATVEIHPRNAKTVLNDDEIIELATILQTVKTDNRDDSHSVRGGEVVIYTLVMTDGTKETIAAFNPSVIINGIGYKTETCYELCNLGHAIFMKQLTSM